MGNIKEKLSYDLDEISSFLGTQFNRRNDVIEMSQSVYLKTILKKLNMENGKPRATPSETYLSPCYKDEANN